MKKYKKDLGRDFSKTEISFFHRLNEESWAFIKTIIDIVKSPILILDKDFRVMVANESFYRMFQVAPSDTEHKRIYEIGNGQWNIPVLRKLLTDILPHNTFFNDFEVSHEFPYIGRKIMTLSARQINSTPGIFTPIIFLAIEDNTPMMAVAETLVVHAKELVAQNAGRTLQLEMYIDKLEKEMTEIREQL